MSYQCDSCEKIFETHRQLKGVKIVHRDGPRYSVSRRKTPTTFICQNCGKQHAYLHSSRNRFCSSECQHALRWREVLIPQVLRGESSDAVAKKYLLQIRGHQCETCKNADWLGDPIPLELEHKDGDHTNNHLDNLELLCPNCHARTPTYKNRNKGNGRAYRRERYAAGKSY